MTSTFTNEGLTLAFEDVGDPAGFPVLLVHGFASNMDTNWTRPGWVKTLGDAGYRVLMFDNRGHGNSDKPHFAEAYTPEKMAGDAHVLLEHVGVERAHIFGYSMGARISAFLALAHPQCVHSLVFGGLGIGMVEGVGDWDPIADALLADSLDDVDHERGRMFRAFADQTKSDRFALAACIKASRTLVTREQAASIAAPTLINVGTKDDIAGDPHALVDLMGNAQAFEIERRDHMLSVGDASFKKAVLAFYNAQF